MIRFLKLIKILIILLILTQHFFVLAQVINDQTEGSNIYAAQVISKFTRPNNFLGENVKNGCYFIGSNPHNKSIENTIRPENKTETTKPAPNVTSPINVINVSKIEPCQPVVSTPEKMYKVLLMIIKSKAVNAPLILNNSKSDTLAPGAAFNNSLNVIKHKKIPAQTSYVAGGGWSVPPQEFPPPPNPTR